MGFLRWLSGLVVLLITYYCLNICQIYIIYFMYLLCGSEYLILERCYQLMVLRFNWIYNIWKSPIRFWHIIWENGRANEFWLSRCSGSIRSLKMLLGKRNLRYDNYIHINSKFSWIRNVKVDIFMRGELWYLQENIDNII